jgi:DNA-binding NarL/FixJ family response regulator
MHRFLLADDEMHKIDKIRAFIQDAFPTSNIRVTRSVKSTLKAVSDSAFDALLLDMSLPTFDVAAGEGGGRPQGFGGIEVLRFLDYRRIKLPAIVITQYEAFKDNERIVNLTELRARLVAAHRSNFVECVYFAPLSDAWQSPLKNLLDDVVRASAGDS